MSEDDIIHEYIDRHDKILDKILKYADKSGWTKAISRVNKSWVAFHKYLYPTLSGYHLREAAKKSQKPGHRRPRASYVE